MDKSTRAQEAGGVVLDNSGLMVELERDADRVEMTVRGEIDLATADELASKLDLLPATSDVRVDMNDVPFLDSTGLSILIRQSMRLRQAGGSLHLRRPGANLRRLLEFCCLDHLIAVEDRRSDA